MFRAYPFKPSSLGLPGQLDHGRHSFRRFSLGTHSAGTGSMPRWVRHKTPAKPRFPQNNGSLTVDVSKTLKTQSISVGYMGVWQTDDGGRLDPDSIQFLQFHDSWS